MTQIDIYTKPWCPYCGRAKNLLDRLDVQYNEINVAANPAREDEMRTRSGRNTVPQIFIGATHVGGSDDLLLAEKNGRLAQLLSSQKTASA